MLSFQGFRYKINIRVSLFMKEENKREDTLKKLDPNEAIEQ